MSGIAGIFHLDGRPVTKGLIESMTAAMDFRGPDGISHWYGGHVALGHCQLHTTTESLCEIQPAISPDQNTVLVLDGRIDNWEALRRELLSSGAPLRNVSDAELVLHAHERWGDDFLAHIDGDFALALWSVRDRRLLLARDRLGNKPLHFWRQGSTVCFASDIHALMSLPWVERVLDEVFLVELLSTDIQSPERTVWRDVVRLPAAHCVGFGPSSQDRMRRYWTPDLFADSGCKADEDYIRRYRFEFDEAVRRKSRSHRPVAFEVSGGLDSSAVFAAAVRLQVAGHLPAPDVHAYTLDFTGDPAADEMAYARAVTQHLQWPLNEIKPFVPPLDWYHNAIDSLLDFPDFPNGLMNGALIEHARGLGCVSLLTGLGGDEWAGGDQSFYAEAWADADFSAILKYASHDLNDGVPRTLWRQLRYGLAPLLPQAVLRPLRTMRNHIFRGDEEDLLWLTPYAKRLLRPSAPDLATLPVSRLGQRRQLQNLHMPFTQFGRVLNERRGAMRGLEVRNPFWDHRFIQFSLCTPEHLRYRDDTNRWLHRQALAQDLPEIVRNRPDKAEFSVVYKPYREALGKWLGTVDASDMAHLASPQGLGKLWAKADEPDRRVWVEGIIWAAYIIGRLTQKQQFFMKSAAQTADSHDRL